MEIFKRMSEKTIKMGGIDRSISIIYLNLINETLKF
jgi:hypothetical protein